jgi:predicted outer membrane protein
MSPRARRWSAAVLVCLGPLIGFAATACNGREALRPGLGASSVSSDPAKNPAGAAVAACPHDDCSLATLRASVAIELRAALLGETRATDPNVRAVARRMVNDFREDQANLDSLETQLAVAEAPCEESRKAAANLEARMPVPGSAFDREFVTSQLAALGEMKQIINRDLIGCAANGSLKTTLRFERMRTVEDGGASLRGLVADLAALRALAAAEPAGAPVETRDQARLFAHPGIVVTRAQLDLVKKNVARGAEPWASAFLRAKSDPHGSLTVVPHPPLAKAATDTTPAAEDGTVLCGSFSDPDVHCSDEKEDGVAAYTQALLWYLSGDERYARNAIAILDAWSSLREHRLFNAALQAGWMGTMFARAAEIMQMSPLWAPADVARFKAMTRRAFLPPLLAALPGSAPPLDPSYGQNGNWVLSIADSLIQLGVLLDDRDVFNRGVALWRDRVPAYCYLASLDGVHPHVPAGGYGAANTGFASPSTRTGDPYGYWGQAGRVLPDGASQETCRDLEHVQFGLGAMMNGAETARIQGIDLYREEAPRMAACMELAALYEGQAPVDASGHLLSYATPVDPAVTLPGREHALCPNAKGEPTVVMLNSGSLASYAVQPTWEVGYNALANRLGMSMPLTRELIMRYRSPPPGWVGATHHMAWETLTHGAL